MRFEIINSAGADSAYPWVSIKLDASETFTALPGTLISMSEAIRMSPGLQGGVKLGLKRLLGGTELFFNRFEAEGPGEVILAPVLPGEILHLPMQGETLLTHSGAFLAGSPGLKLDTQWKGARTRFFGRQRDLQISGSGDLFLSAFGAVHEFHLAPKQKLSVDHAHLFAMEARLGFQIRNVGGRFASLLGGGGRISEHVGPGRLYVQSRSAQGLVAWLAPRVVK